MASSPLGLSLQLSPETIASLNSRQDATTATPEVNSDSFVEENEQEEIAVSTAPPIIQDGEAWDDTMAVPLNYLQEVGDTDSANSNDGSGDDASSVTSDTTEISLSAPPSLPLVVVNLRLLCGFVPSTPEEAEQLRQQVVVALSQDDDEHVADGSSEAQQEEEQEHDSLSRHFDKRVQELFDNGVANHSDTLSEQDSNNDTDLSLAVIEYPEFLCRNDVPQVLVTARQWKRLLKQHSIPIVERLLQHLQKCNRPLSWKVDMHEELVEMVKKEDSFRKLQLEESQLHYWKTQRRKEQLDKLYQVRETFDSRVEAALDTLEQLEKEREEATRTKLREMQEGGGLEALDFNTNIFSFGRDAAATRDALDYENNDTVLNDEDFGSDSGYENEGHDDDADGSDSIDDTNESLDNDVNDAAATLPTPHNKERAQARRRKASQKAQQRRLQSQQEAAKEQARIEQAHLEEERVRDACTTPAFKMAEATVKSLEERMQQVDDLLESLQEEEWADEEEGITQTEGESTGAPASSKATTTKDEFSLLDSILAMILGSLPQPSGVSAEEHYKFVRNEHQEIVKDWKEHFGRLPWSCESADGAKDSGVSDAAVGMQQKQQQQQNVSFKLKVQKQPYAMPPMSAADLKQSLGITDNVDLDNWDDVDDHNLRGTKLDKTSRSKEKATKTKSPVVGLRPGGKVSRR